jgi:peptidyl-prolyl cis-trans isomerase D
MLNALRARAASWVVRVLFVLLILSFAAWGIGDIFRLQTGSDTAVQVGDLEISREALAAQFDREIRRMQPIFGNRLDREQARQLGLLDRAVDQLVADALIDQEAARLGVTVTDETVRRVIHGMEPFKGIGGSFDINRFRQILAENELTEQGYIELVRGDLRREQVAAAIAAGAAAPDILAETLVRHRYERRVAEVAHLPVDAAAEVGEPDEAKLREWYEAHQDSFQAPEVRALTYVHLSAQEVAEGIAVPDEEVRAEFDARADSLGRPERREVEQVVFADEASARKAADLIAGGADLAAAARDAGGRTPVSLGPVEKRQLPATVADVAFATPAGQVSAPVQSPLGWHIVKVTRIEAGHTPTFDEAREEIRQELALRSAADQLANTANAFEDALAAGGTLEEAAAKVGLEAHRIAAVDASGAAPTGTPAEGVPAVPQFLSTAFATGKGETSSLIEADDGGYVMVRVDEVTPARPQPYEEVRSEVLQRWLSERLDELTRERATALVERIKGGADFAAASVKAGAEARTSKPLLRTEEDKDAGLDAAAIARLFELKPGEVTVEPGDGGFTVLRVKEIVAAVPAAETEALKETREAASVSVSAELLRQYEDALKGRFPVTVDRDAIETLF